MNPRSERRLGAACWLIAAACGGGGSSPIDGAIADGANGDAAADAGRDAAIEPPACVVPTGLGRGLTWVRAEPMMIAGLVVAMGAPSTTAVNDYFDSFHANTVHTWQTGLPAEIAGWSTANHAGFRYVSWVNSEGNSDTNSLVIGGAAPLAGRIGYQISDEPQDTAAFNAAVAGAQAVKAVDPDGLRIINLNNTSSANNLRTMAAQHADFDILSYDNYRWGTSAHSGLASTRAAALAAGKPYWRYIRSFFYKVDSPEGDASDLRWDTFVGAVYGFTGYTWFVYSIAADNSSVAPLLFSVGGDFAATKTAQYAEAAGLNVELARLGTSLVRLRSTDVRYVAKLINLSGLPVWTAGAGGDPFLKTVTLGGQADALIGTFRDDCDEAYVMVQNQAHSGADFPNASNTPKPFTLAFDFAGATDPSLDPGSLEALDLTTGAVVALPLTSTGATTAKLDLTLAAGDIVLFKYKTSRAFASQ